MVLGSSKRRWEEASRREAKRWANDPEGKRRHEEEHQKTMDGCAGCGCFLFLLFILICVGIAAAMPSSPYCPAVC
jgi:hypothetical protein